MRHHWLITLISQHAVTKPLFVQIKVNKGVKTPVTVHASAQTGDTNLDLKGSGFAPIAGILELVDRTLVNGVSLLTWGKKRGKMKEKE